jgi:hypothetical protein
VQDSKCCGVCGCPGGSVRVLEGTYPISRLHRKLCWFRFPHCFSRYNSENISIKTLYTATTSSSCNFSLLCRVEPNVVDNMEYRSTSLIIVRVLIYHTKCFAGKYLQLSHTHTHTQKHIYVYIQCIYKISAE